MKRRAAALSVSGWARYEYLTCGFSCGMFSAPHILYNIPLSKGSVFGSTLQVNENSIIRQSAPAFPEIPPSTRRVKLMAVYGIFIGSARIGGALDTNRRKSARTSRRNHLYRIAVFTMNNVA